MSYFKLHTRDSVQFFNKDQYYIAWELFKSLRKNDSQVCLNYVSSDSLKDDTCAYVRAEFISESNEISIDSMELFLEKAAAFTGCFKINAVVVSEDVYAMYNIAGKLIFFYSPKLFVLERFLKYEFNEWRSKNGLYRKDS